MQLLAVLLAALATALIQGLAFLVSYVANNVFPRPLKPEEEAAYLEAYAGGDPSARNILIERNLRLVAHIVKKFDNTGEDTDDLISIGTIGLIKAINTFDRHKQTRLATYAARCIENEILMYLRSTKRLRHEVMLHDPIGADKEGNEITLIDVLACDGDVEERVERKIDEERMFAGLSHLTGREKRVLELRYGLVDGIRKTQRKSQGFGNLRSYVSRIESGYR